MRRNKDLVLKRREFIWKELGNSKLRTVDETIKALSNKLFLSEWTIWKDYHAYKKYLNDNEL